MPDPYGPALSFLTSLDISYKIAKDRRDKLNTGALDASPAEMQGRSAAPGPLAVENCLDVFRGRKIFAPGKADDEGGLAPAEEDNAAGHKKMVSAGGIQTI